MNETVVRQNYPVADNLREIIKERGIPMAELSRRAGLNDRTVARIISGWRIAYPREIKAICEALGIEIATVFEDIEDVDKGII